jgi:3-phenylpropionate/trans-cinnamate dioxygenase ferredoxin reductase subunit
MTDPFVVVGADAAGLSAASKCRRTDPDREVIVLDAGRWVSFAHCGTPYYVKGEITELTAMTALTPADVRERGIDLRTEHRVTAVDTSQQRVTVDGPDGQTEVGYGELLIATGAHARTTPLSDEALAGVFTLHGLDDAAAIRAFLTDPDAYDRADVGADERLDWDRVDAMGAMAPPAQLAIIGGGYVGVEMAEALAAWDVEVVLLHRGAGLLETFGQTAGERAVDALEALGVTVELGTEVRSVEAADGQVSAVLATDGRSWPVQGAIVGTGIAPATDLITDTPIDLGDSGAVATDAFGRTSVPGVYAAGDVAESIHVVTGEATWDPLGLPANRAGRAIGATIGGEQTAVGQVAHTAMVKAGAIEVGRTGIIREDAAVAAGFEPVAVEIEAASRSHYYPGSEPLWVRLVADRQTHRVLGGMTVGTDGAALRINTVATALHAGYTVVDLMNVDMGYAPPFSPVWDPVLTAAKVLDGRL